MKISIARKNLFHEKTRFFISVGGVALAILLMLFLLGMWQGISSAYTAYPEKNPAQIIISKEGITDLFHGVSIVSSQDAEIIKNTTGVDEVVGMITLPAIYEKNGRKQDMFLVSYEPGSRLGAPWNIIAGGEAKGKNEIVLDAGFAKKNNLLVGDRINLLDVDFKIVGLNKGGSTILASFGFIRLSDAQEILKLIEATNWLYVSLLPGADPASVRTSIAEQTTGLTILTKDEFITNTLAELEETFLPIINAMVAIAVAVGIAIIGLTVYTATIEKSREYGILKAIGVKNRYLYFLVFEQAGISAAIGFLVGLALAFGAASLSARSGQIPIEFSFNIIAIVFGLTIFISLISSYIPMKKIANIDPAEVFKA